MSNSTVTLATPRQSHKDQIRYVAAVFAMGLASCGLPEYRILVSQIPSDGKKLEIASYVQPAGAPVGTVPGDRISADIPSSRRELRVSVNLKGSYNFPESAVFAAIVRDAAGCISAIGSSVCALPSGTVADIELPLFLPRFPSASLQRCSATGPVVVDVQRQEQGPFGRTDFRLLVGGWDFSPEDQVTVRSMTALKPEVCQSPSCTGRCRDTVACTDRSGLMIQCRTGCTMITTAEFDSPGRFIVHVPDAANVVQDSAGGAAELTESATLAIMRASPFQVTIHRPMTGQSSSYTEPKSP